MMMTINVILAFESLLAVLEPENRSGGRYIQILTELKD